MTEPRNPAERLAVTRPSSRFPSTAASAARIIAGPMFGAGAGPFTVFAPTNEAFKAVPAKTMAELAEEMLRGVLTFHVLPVRAVAGDHPLFIIT